MTVSGSAVDIAGSDVYRSRGAPIRNPRCCNSHRNPDGRTIVPAGQSPVQAPKEPPQVHRGLQPFAGDVLQEGKSVN